MSLQPCCKRFTKAERRVAMVVAEGEPVREGGIYSAQAGSVASHKRKKHGTQARMLRRRRRRRRQVAGLCAPIVSLVRARHVRS